MLKSNGGKVALVFIGLAFGMAACGTDPLGGTATSTATTTPTGGTGTTADAAGKVLEGKAALENHDILTANAKFSEALKSDPANKDANLGLSITGGVLLLQDADVVSIVQGFGSTIPPIKCAVYNESCPTTTSTGGSVTATSAALFLKPTGVAPWSDTLPHLVGTVTKKIKSFSDTQGKQKQAEELSVRSVASKALVKMKAASSNKPAVSEVQAVIENKILPTLDGITDKLAKIEGTGYVFALTPAMQTNPQTAKTILLDDGEFLLFDAAIRFLKIWLLGLTAYNLDLDYAAFESDPLSILYGPGGTATNPVSTIFFTLKTNGNEKMTQAHNEAKTMMVKLSAAHLFLESDTDTATDNGVRFPDPDLSAKDHLNAHYGLEKLTAAFNGPTSVTTDNGPDDTAGTSDDVKTITIDLTKWFTAPLTRDFLPTFGYDLPRNATLSVAKGTCASFEHFNPSTNAVDDLVECHTYPTSNLPELVKTGKFTLNGVIPGGIPNFDGFLPMAGAIYVAGLDKPQYSWNSKLTSDGTMFYLQLDIPSGATTSPYYYSTPIQRVYHIDNTGKIHHVVDIKGMSYINSLAYLNGVWASGRSGSPDYKSGVFKLDAGPFGAGKILQTISATSTSFNPGPLAADSSNLYLFSNPTYFSTYVGGTYVPTSYPGSLFIFPPTATTLPNPVSGFSYEEGWAGAAVYDGADFWIDGNKVDILTGKKKTHYWNDDFQAFHGGFLWTTGWDPYRLIKYQKP